MKKSAKNEHNQIAAWGKLVGINNATEPCDLTGFFQHFRPNGVGVESVFTGHEYGEEILSRVRQCYECTQLGWLDSDAYFIPRPVNMCHESEARSLLNLHFKEMAILADHVGDQELKKILTDLPLNRVKTASELKQIPFPSDTPEGWLFDFISDYMGSLEVIDSPLRSLHDAMYSIANNIYLENHLLWPLYKDSASSTDPFTPAFELWSKGISYSFQSPEACRFWIYESE